jgi:hypothetical protein
MCACSLSCGGSKSCDVVVDIMRILEIKKAKDNVPHEHCIKNKMEFVDLYMLFVTNATSPHMILGCDNSTFDFVQL